MAWEPWIPTEGPRKLRRALTTDERSALEIRRDELIPAVAPFVRVEAGSVVLALADMFGSYRSMRQTGEDALATVEAAQRALQDFPAWAILKVCLSIQTNGVWRNGAFDRQWAPNDSEIVDAVRKEVRLYADRHRSAVALLTATVIEGV